MWDIKGTVVHSGKNRYSLTYQAPTREPQVSRDNEMPGYSGTALFENENGNRYFTGCLSCEAGDRTAGSRVWVTSYSLFWDEISKFDMSPSIPDSFLPSVRGCEGIVRLLLRHPRKRTNR